MRGARAAGVLAIVASIVVAACATDAPATPGPTLVVAAETDAPTPSSGPSVPSVRPSPQPTTPATATPDPATATPDPAATSGPATTDRTSLDLRVTYDVKAAITVATGMVEATTLLRVRNESGAGIDHLALNTVAARLGGIRILESTVDDVPVRTRIDDQTIVVPLGFVLADGASTDVRVGYRARLGAGLVDPDWLFTNANGVIAMHRWIPWVSRALPFDRPNAGDPFVTPTSPRVDVEIVADEPLILAAPSTEVVKAAVGRGGAWAFTVENVRDVSIVMAPDFRVLKGEAGGIPVEIYTRAGSLNRERLLTLARQAITSQSKLLGVEFPRPMLAVVETEAGEALETPGLIWVPRTETSLNRSYLVHHAVAQQWFYGLVGNDQRAEPFADEAPADFLARTALNLFRPSRCPVAALDRGIAAYSRTCYYEVVLVQGGLLLEDIRVRVGNARFWGALRAYLEAHEHGLAGTRDLLQALRAANERVNLSPTLRSRFPSLY